MVEIATKKFHKLLPESGVVHGESDAISSSGEGVKSFLEQFEGQEKLIAAFRIAAAIGPAVLEAKDEAGASAAWPLSSDLAEAARGLRLIYDVASIAERCQESETGSQTEH